MSRVRIYHAIWDRELRAYFADAFNTTDENRVHAALMAYIGPGQDDATMNELDDLTADELATVIGNVVIERSFSPFRDDVQIVDFE